jgi:hypothetical protein
MAYEIVTYTDEDGKLVTCKKEDAPEWVQHNWPQPLTFRKEGNNIYVSHSKKEEPKQECDHLIGVAGYVDDYCFDGDQINLSDLTGINTTTKWVTCIDDIRARFYFCPKKGCGAPIDWDKIKESLKQSNEKD